MSNSVVVGVSGPELQFSPGRIAPAHSAFVNNRKPLAAEFLFRGQRVFVIANHFNSKAGDDPLFGRSQPPIFGTETQRLQCAQVVSDFVESILAVDPNARVVVMGRFNDSELTDAMNQLEASMANLIGTLATTNRYTYNLGGNSQMLHHILVSPSLTSGSTLEVVHVNSEYVESNRFSEHDPLVARVLTGPATFPEWQSIYFTTAELADPLVSGFSADFDQDGKTHGIEAALGTNPRSAADAPAWNTAIVGIDAGQKLALLLDMPSFALIDLTLTIEESPSLATNSWTTIATRVDTNAWSGPATVTVTPISTDRVHVEAQSLQNFGVEKTFLRLKVSQ